MDGDLIVKCSYYIFRVYYNRCSRGQKLEDKNINRKTHWKGNQTEFKIRHKPWNSLDFALNN